MLSLVNCCPQLYIGNYKFRIYNRPIEIQEKISVDGIVYKDDCKLGSAFRRFLVNLEGSPSSQCDDLLKNYGLEMRNRGNIAESNHIISIGMLFLNRLRHPNITHIYGLLHDGYYCDREENLQSLSDFLATCTDQQFIHVFAQILNLVTILEESYEIRCIDLLSMIKIQNLTYEFTLNFNNNRTLLTDCLVKLCNFTEISIVDGNNKYCFSEKIKSLQKSLSDLIEYVRSIRTDLEFYLDQDYDNFYVALENFTTRKYLLPRSSFEEQLLKFSSRDTRFFCAQDCSNIFLELERISTLKDYDANLLKRCPDILDILRHETDIIHEKIKNINEVIKNNPLPSLDELEEPDIGLGTGFYEKKIIMYIIKWSILNDIIYWKEKVKKFQTEVPKIEKIIRQINKVSKKFTVILSVIMQHRTLIEDSPLFRSYISAYELFNIPR